MDFDSERSNLNHRNAQRGEEEDEQVEWEPESDESFYSLFNLPKDASSEEIHKKFKALAGEILYLVRRLWLR